MATSGTIQGNGVNIGGNGGNYFFINWQLAGQDINGNYSVINWQAYFHYNGADAQLDNGFVDAAGARRWTNGGRIYNYQGNFSTRNLALASGSFNVGHDGAGNGSFGIGGSVVVFGSGSSGASQGFSLPTIPRYANITTFYLDNVTDASLRINWGADANCDYVSWWSNAYDGGIHHDIPVSGSGLFQISLNNLVSDRDYDVRVAVRRADSGLWTESGTATTRTAVQANMFLLL